MTKKEASFLSKDLQEAEGLVQTELARRVYHLRTLYDLSKELFGSVEVETILRNFLFMTMGNFGASEGLVLSCDIHSKTAEHFFSMGFNDIDNETLKRCARDSLQIEGFSTLGEKGLELSQPECFPSMIKCVIPFELDSDSNGLLALGGKLVGESYSEEDRELLVTLVNNLVVALKTARSFEEITLLNQDLQEKNEQLEKALDELTAALRKVEILENIKANLSKFVPTTVTRIIEKSPKDTDFDSKERDVSVLFLDIEAYTKLTERVGATEVTRLIEKYFSVFMDAIYLNNGDVNETAGDGLMVLFLSEDEATNALEAVRTALMIREKAALINQEDETCSESLIINMGICSGNAVVGAAKFESYTGSRWTYTCYGTTTNVAARICSQANGGAILVSKETAGRTTKHFSLSPLGRFSLKNVSEEVELFSVE